MSFRIWFSCVFRDFNIFIMFWTVCWKKLCLRQSIDELIDMIFHDVYRWLCFARCVNIFERNKHLRQSMGGLLNMFLHDCLENVWLHVFKHLPSKKAPLAEYIYIYIYELFVCFNDVLIMFNDVSVVF